MKKKPVRIVSTTLGAKLNTNGLGWALVRAAGNLPTERIRPGDPLALALDQVPVGEHVDFICYSDEASFAQSQAARDGLTRKEHVELVKNLCAQLHTHGRRAAIKWVTVEP